MTKGDFGSAYRSYVRQVIGRRSGSLSAIQVGASEGRAIVAAGLLTSCLTTCVAAERS
jgi:hypothetical protein